MMNFQSILPIFLISLTLQACRSKTPSKQMFIQRTFDLSQPESKKILDAWVALNMPSLLSLSRDSLERLFKKSQFIRQKIVLLGLGIMGERPILFTYTF
jgi:hypothetical protein